MSRSIRVAVCLPVLAAALGAVAGLAAAGEVTFSRKLLMVSPNEGCAVADVNNDGKLDVIAGTHWFAAPDYVPRPLREIGEFGGDFLKNNGDHALDVDADGWVDVVAGGWMEPEVFWFKNPGAEGLEKGLKWEPRLLNVGRGQNEAYDLRDLNGDGKPELFVSSWDKKAPLVCWKFITGADSQPKLEQVTLGDQGSGHGYAFGDINGDGREDILTETGWYERPEGDPFATLWKFHPETALPHPSCPCLIVDLTGDGRNDIIWGKAHDYGLYWWEQGEPKADGTTTWTEHLIDDTWSQVHCLVWADLDGDGQGEVITGKRVRAHTTGDPGVEDPACLYYYTWDAAAKKFTRYDVAPLGSGVGAGMQIRVADLNADGRLDIAVPGKTGTWVLLNEGVK